MVVTAKAGGKKTVAAQIRQTATEPKNPEIRRNIARIMLKNQQTESARDWALTALELDLRNPAVHEILMQCYLKLGDQSRAEKHRNLLQELKK